MPKYVRLRDVAEAAGVHPGTVSKALSGHPKIPPATRDRIRGIAKSLGYRPDPLLASLSRFRRASSPTGRAMGNLAFITSWAPPTDPILRWGQRFILPAAIRAAEERGYRLTSFDLAEERLSGRELGKILYARGIVGLILAESPLLHSLDGVDWSRFSLIGIGHGITAPRIERIVPNPYTSMTTAIQELAVLGRKRIALFLRSVQDERSLFQWSAAYVSATRRHGYPEFPILEADEADPRRIEAWLRKSRPDAILYYSHLHLPPLTKAARKVLRQLPVFCCLNVPLGEPGPGICQRLDFVGELAVGTLIAKINRHERGECTEEILVSVGGVWVP